MLRYCNNVLLAEYDPDEDMDLVYYENIYDFGSPEFDGYQRSDGDLPTQDRDYKVMFSSSRLEFGALLLKEVTCRVRKSPESDDEFKSLYRNASEWCHMGTRRFAERAAQCFMSVHVSLMQFFTDSVDGYRIAGDIRAETQADVERLAKKLILRQP